MRATTILELMTLPALAILVAPAVLHWTAGPDGAASPAVVEVAPGDVPGWTETGEHLLDGMPVAAPEREIVRAEPLPVMRHLVTRAEYGRCVAAGGCKPAQATGPEDAPVNGVDFFDAQAYAQWLSAQTGWRWRLPTAEEWAFAARERFGGETSVFGDPSNPAVSWLRRYREEAARSRKADPVPRRSGAYGVNSAGIADMAGNVWEWTSTCYSSTAQTAAGGATRLDNCGIRVVEGRHRAYMTDFIRDGKSGGCAVGTPPDNLGIRLVREPKGAIARLRDRLARG